MQPASSLPAIPKRDSDDYPEVGSWNHLEACIGQRGTGKSTFQCYRALELSRIANGAYVIGHSLGARLPSKLPAELGGTTLPIVYHPTIDKLERALIADILKIGISAILKAEQRYFFESFLTRCH